MARHGYTKSSVYNAVSGVKRMPLRRARIDRRYTVDTFWPKYFWTKCLRFSDQMSHIPNHFLAQIFQEIPNIAGIGFAFFTIFCFSIHT